MCGIHNCINIMFSFEKMTWKKIHVACPCDISCFSLLLYYNWWEESWGKKGWFLVVVTTYVIYYIFAQSILPSADIQTSFTAARYSSFKNVYLVTLLQDRGHRRTLIFFGGGEGEKLSKNEGNNELLTTRISYFWVDKYQLLWCIHVLAVKTIVAPSTVRGKNRFVCWLSSFFVERNIRWKEVLHHFVFFLFNVPSDCWIVRVVTMCMFVVTSNTCLMRWIKFAATVQLFNGRFCNGDFCPNSFRHLYYIAVLCKPWVFFLHTF